MPTKTEGPTEEPTRATAKAKSKYQGKKDIFFLVNPAGAVHDVIREQARGWLSKVGWRLATDEEIEKYKIRPTQRFDDPIAKPWTPEPDELIELPGE